MRKVNLIFFFSLLLLIIILPAQGYLYCKDTDGLAYDKFGKVGLASSALPSDEEIKYVSDYCTTGPGSTSECSGESCYIVEFTCESFGSEPAVSYNYKYNIMSCKELGFIGCKDGACIKEASSDSEKDLCSNSIKDSGETDVDCGGTCGMTCAAGKKCLTSADCKSSICDGGKCISPASEESCSDKIKNRDETGVDCGGKYCNPCKTPPPTNDYKSCAKHCGLYESSDYSYFKECTLTCYDLRLKQCYDGIINNEETGKDCGGGYCKSCEPIKAEPEEPLAEKPGSEFDECLNACITANKGNDKETNACVNVKCIQYVKREESPEKNIECGNSCKKLYSDDVLVFEKCLLEKCKMTKADYYRVSEEKEAKEEECPVCKETKCPAQLLCNLGEYKCNAIDKTLEICVDGKWKNNARYQDFCGGTSGASEEQVKNFIRENQNESSEDEQKSKNLLQRILGFFGIGENKNQNSENQNRQPPENNEEQIMEEDVEIAQQIANRDRIVFGQYHVSVDNDPDSPNYGQETGWSDLIIANADGSEDFINLGRGSAPVWSTDGNSLAYLNDNNLLVKSLSDGSEITLDNYAFSPDWSHDSDYIAYVRNTDEPKVVVAHPDGTNLMDLGLGSSPDWSPDGQWVLFHKTETNGVTYLYKKHPDNTGETRLVKGSFGKFSPDGTKIAYFDEAAVFVVNVDGTDKIAYAPGFIEEWSPYGTSILYIKDDGIYLYNISGGTAKRIATGMSPSFSSDGTKIVYETNEGTIATIEIGSNLEVELYTGSNPAWIPTGNPLTGMDPFAEAPEEQQTGNLSEDNELSPDSTRVIYSKDGHYWSMRLDSTDLVDLGEGRGLYWSHNGEKIAMTYTDSGQSMMAIMDPQGSGRINIAGSSPIWSPDSLKLAYMKGTRVYIYYFDSNNEMGYTPSTSYVSSWSQDSRYIVIKSTLQENRWSIFEPPDAQQRVGNFISVSPITISPDGTKVAYDLNGTVYTASVSGSQITAVAQGSGPKWSYDGTRLSYAKNESYNVSGIPHYYSAIHTINPDGSNDYRLSPGENNVDWSPRELRLGFTSRIPGTSTSYGYINRDTGNDRVDIASGGFGKWSYDGTKATSAHISYFTGYDLGRREMTSLYYGDKHFFTPDGTKLVYTRVDDGIRKVFIAPFGRSGSDSEELLTEGSLISLQPQTLD